MLPSLSLCFVWRGWLRRTSPGRLADAMVNPNHSEHDGTRRRYAYPGNGKSSPIRGSPSLWSRNRVSAWPETCDVRLGRPPQGPSALSMKSPTVGLVLWKSRFRGEFRGQNRVRYPGLAKPLRRKPLCCLPLQVEPPTGFEPVTPSLQVRCSAELSYGGRRRFPP